MTMPLFMDHFAPIATANRVLLAPLDYPSIDDWRREAMRMVARAVGADMAAFILPGHEPLMAVYEMDATVRSPIDCPAGPPWPAAAPGTGWPSARPIGRRPPSLASHSEVRVAEHTAAHTDDAPALVAPTAAGTARLTLRSRQRPTAPREHLPVLRILHPAFKAGLDALDRFASARAILDALDEPLLLFDEKGVEQHRNPAFTRLAALDPETHRLEDTVATLNRRVRLAALGHHGDVSGGTLLVAELRTARARYVLRAVPCPIAFGQSASFLVSVAADRGTPRLPTAEEMCTRHILTRREAEVAVLVAQGLSNEDIAARLGVSRHTVRHHVEAVMAKLDVSGHGREAVAARVLGLEIT